MTILGRRPISRQNNYCLFGHSFIDGNDVPPPQPTNHTLFALCAATEFHPTFLIFSLCSKCWHHHYQISWDRWMWCMCICSWRRHQNHSSISIWLAVHQPTTLLSHTQFMCRPPSFPCPAFSSSAFLCSYHHH